MKDVENKRAHLQMIQAAIERMSVNSFLLKGWSVVLVSALFAWAAGRDERIFVCFACLPAIAFWMLDSYYVQQERLFRKLYDRVRFLEESAVNFSMNTRSAKKKGVSRLRRCRTLLCVGVSGTLCIFHGAVLGSIFIVMLFMANN